MLTAVSIRMSDGLVYELECLARTMERFRTYIIQSYLQEYADYSVAIERLNDKDDEIISSDKMRNRLAL